MNTNRYRTCARNMACFIVITAICSQVTPVHAQGSLTPPGAPAPTMRSLEEVYQRLSVLEANQAACHKMQKRQVPQTMKWKGATLCE